MTALLLTRTICNSDAEANRRADMGMVMNRKSIGARGDYCRTPTTVVEKYFDERELREEFATLIADLTPRQIAKASGCTIDAAKMWLAAMRLPNMASTFNMSQRLPRVNEWVQRKGGIGAASAQIATLRQFVADEVREIVKKPAAPSADQPEDRSAWAVRDMFRGRA
jgi:hypothetical protein